MNEAQQPESQSCVQAEKTGYDARRKKYEQSGKAKERRRRYREQIKARRDLDRRARNGARFLSPLGSYSGPVRETGKTTYDKTKDLKTTPHAPVYQLQVCNTAEILTAKAAASEEAILDYYRRKGGVA
jgi:hypothetical protein